jgi:hypothetical protein
MKLLLNDTDWLPICKAGLTIDGREIYASFLQRIDETFHSGNAGHIPYWNKNHIKGDMECLAEARPRLGNIVDTKFEDNTLFVKSKNLDNTMLAEIIEGKYPHISAEFYPYFTGEVETFDDGTEVQFWDYRLEGAAVVSWSAAVPAMRTVELTAEREKKQAMIETDVQNTDKRAIHLLSFNSIGGQNMGKKETAKIKNNAEETKETKETKPESQEKIKKEQKKNVEAQEEKYVQASMLDEGFEPIDKIDSYPTPDKKEINRIIDKYNKLQKEYDRVKEDLKEAKEQNLKAQQDADEAQESLIEQDFVITILDRFNRNKITEADLELDMPEGITIKRVSDYIKYSQIYKKYWKDPTMREFLKQKWQKREPISLSGDNLGFNPLSFNTTEHMTDDEIIRTEAERRCQQQKLIYHSTEGSKVKWQVRNEFYKNPPAFRKQYEKFTHYGN